jgi:hypothetical protein
MIIRGAYDRPVATAASPAPRARPAAPPQRAVNVTRCPAGFKDRTSKSAAEHQPLADVKRAEPPAAVRRDSSGVKPLPLS